IARQISPAHASEAFVVGLMLDAGIPLMFKMLGEPYAKVLELAQTPTRLFRAEFDNLPFTHVDVTCTLARRWRRRELRARRIEWHHNQPSALEGREPMHVLHRVAYYTGAVGLTSKGTPADLVPLPGLARKYLGIEVGALEEVFQAAVR